MDTQNLGPIIFVLVLATLLGGSIIWLLYHSVRKTVRVFRAAPQIESTSNRVLSVLVLTLIAISAVLLYQIAYPYHPPGELKSNIYHTYPSSIPDWHMKAVASFCAFVLAVVFGFLIHPVQKPRPRGSSRLYRLPVLGWILKHKVASTVLSLVILTICILVYQEVALQMNRHSFQQARKNIDIVYADIVAKVGPPDNSERMSTCSVYHGEFSDGPTSCNLDTAIIYGVKDKNDADATIKKIQDRMNNYRDLFTPTKTPDLSIKDTLAVNTVYHIASVSYKSAGLDCGVGYVYDTPTETDLSLKDNTKKPLQMNIGCWGGARSKYYTLSH